jgi:hypothetical protein
MKEVRVVHVHPSFCIAYSIPCGVPVMFPALVFYPFMMRNSAGYSPDSLLPPPDINWWNKLYVCTTLLKKLNKVIESLLLELSVDILVEMRAELHCLVELVDYCTCLWLIGIDPCLSQ